MFHNGFREPDSALARLKHQIDTLKIFNDNVTEVVPEEEYKVDFSAGGKVLSLIVKLGPEFPHEKPSLYVYPPVIHPWVSPNGEIVSAPGLLNFTILSDLGRVVQAIIREFVLRPPHFLDGDITSPQPITSNNNFSYATSSSSSLFPALTKLTTAQLKELNDNPDLLNKFIDSLNFKSSFSEKVNELIEQNENLASDNLKREPELNQLREDVSSLYETLQEEKSKYEELSSEYKKYGDKYNPHNIIERIRKSVSEIDEESEKIAESFLSGTIDLDTFLFDYVNHRIISHSRKVKDEKLSHQLEKLHQAGY